MVFRFAKRELFAALVCAGLIASPLGRPARAPASADTTSPTIAIDAPLANATVGRHAAVSTAFSCADNEGGSGVATCTAPALLDTSTLGVHSFTVTASDFAGNTASQSVSYAVVPWVSSATLLSSRVGNRIPLSEARGFIVRTIDASGDRFYSVLVETASPGVDYKAQAKKTVRFAPGNVSKNISIRLLAATTSDATERFAVVLSAPTNAVVDKSSGTVTLIHPSAGQSANIGDASIVEGDAKTRTVALTVSLA